MISLVVTLLVVGVLLWLFETYVPMDATIKRIIQIVVIVCVIVYVLSAFGVLGRADIPVPQLRH